MSAPKAAPAIWPYAHRTIEQVDADERAWERAGTVNAIRWAKFMASEAARHRRNSERKRGAA